MSLCPLIADGQLIAFAAFLYPCVFPALYRAVAFTITLCPVLVLVCEFGLLFAKIGIYQVLPSSDVSSASPEIMYWLYVDPCGLAVTSRCPLLHSPLSEVALLKVIASPMNGVRVSVLLETLALLITPARFSAVSVTGFDPWKVAVYRFSTLLLAMSTFPLQISGTLIPTALLITVKTSLIFVVPLSAILPASIRIVSAVWLMALITPSLLTFRLICVLVCMIPDHRLLFALATLL